MLQENNIIEQYTPLVESFVGSFNPIDNSTFNDYKQAGLIGLLKAVRSYDNKRSFVKFASTCIKNEILNHIRTEQKHRHIPFFYIPRSNIHNSLWEYLPKLPIIEYKILMLRIQGYTFKEISSILNLFSRYWISYRYKKIIKHIKKANHG